MNDERIVILETKLESMERAFVESRNQRRADMERIFTKLDEIQERLATHIPCPAPGSCLRLEKSIQDVTEDVKVLEAARNKALGERAITGSIAGFIGAGIIAFLNWLAK